MAPLGRGGRAGGRRTRPTTATRLRSAVGSRVSSVSWQAKRVHHAARPLVLEGVVEAGLVAGDAGVDASARPSAAFLTKSGSARKGRAIDIRSASPPARTCSATSGVLMRLEVTRGMDTTPLSRSSPGDPRVGPSGNHGRDGRHARLVPADARIDDAGPGLLDGLRELDDLGPWEPSFMRSSIERR